jgi:hypothetical protein
VVTITAVVLARSAIATAVVIVGFLTPSVSARAQDLVTEDRITRLEREIRDLREAVDATAEKDLWDKLEASGALIGGVLVAAIGAFATIAYNTRQQRAAERQAAQQLIVNRVQTGSSPSRVMFAVEWVFTPSSGRR